MSVVFPVRRAGAGVAVVAALLTGCQPTATLDTTAGKSPALAESLQAADEQTSPATSLLAMQSQRDVEAILRSRGTTAALPESAAAFSSLPPVIRWNERRGEGQTSAGVAAAAVQQIGTSPSPEVSGPNTAAPPVAAVPATLGPDRLRTLMVDLSRELYATGAYSDSPLRELMMIAAMSMVDPQRQLDPNAIPDLTEKERELLGALQRFFANLGQALEGRRDTEQAIVEAVATLRETLVKPKMLRLPTAALCTRVGGFGDYTPFDRLSFLAQSQQKVIVYLEIENFESDVNQKGEHVTRIAQQLIIYSDRDGIPVWKEDWQTAVDVTRNRRQDFFTVQVITLPRALSVGRYQLKVRVRDEKTGAEAETSIPFEMVADPRLATK